MITSCVSVSDGDLNFDVDIGIRKLPKFLPFMLPLSIFEDADAGFGLVVDEETASPPEFERRNNLIENEDKLEDEVKFEKVEEKLLDCQNVSLENSDKPPAYVHINRNKYLCKKPKPFKKQKRNDSDAHSCACLMSKTGTDNYEPICGEDCLCSLMMICCSKSCACQQMAPPPSRGLPACQNRAFQHRKMPAMKIVKTEKCGWGAIVEENVKAGSFVVEYVGEVIDDATCEQRLWDAKMSGESNFYLCQISRDQIIDARYKGNFSRFVNHSCDPNLQMQKWEMDGETRIGLFAKKNIPAGSVLSYDYQFVQFGEAKSCHCGSAKCTGEFGSCLTKPSAGQPVRAGSGPAGGPSPDLECKPLSARKLCGMKRRSLEPPSGVPEPEPGPPQGLNTGSKFTNSDIGRRVSIWWPLDKKYFRGTLLDYDPLTGLHLVKYDDGESERLNLKEEKWNFEVTTFFPAGQIASRNRLGDGFESSVGEGSKVRVWFPKLHRFRYGTISEMPLISGKATKVAYDDGGELELNMKVDRWEIVTLPKRQRTR